MMKPFPSLGDDFRIRQLVPPNGPIRMVLDTDTFNEVDDQYAVAYALGSSERITVEALYAAPFHNKRSSGPGEGMQKSYEEILRLLELMKLGRKPPVFKGATAYLNVESPQRTAVTDDLIERAMRGSAKDPLYVTAIGAITNIASAMLLEPRIIERIVVLWLGGHAPSWPDTREFNLWQDPASARVILDSGVPAVIFPCLGVVDRLRTTIPELEACLGGRGALADYLLNITRKYNTTGRTVWSKVIWDVVPIVWLIHPEWVWSHLTHSPLLTADGTWSFDPRRHLIRVANYVYRDEILGDLFEKILRL